MKKMFVAFLLWAVMPNSLIMAKPNPLAAFKIDNIWYFLDETGKELFPAQILEGVGSYSEGKFFVKKRNKDTSYFCYYDTKGKELFKVNSSLPFDFHTGRVLTVKYLDEKGEKRLYGYMDDKGNILHENVLEDGLDFSDSLAYIQKGADRGYIGLDGKFKFLIDPYDVGYRFSEGIAAISNNDFLFAFIDTSGKIIIPFKYDEAGEFKEGLCKVYYESKFGFINRKGDFVIDHRYDDTRNFSEGFAFVGKNDDQNNVKWGFINKDGSLIEDYIYSNVWDFSEGLAAVSKDNKWGFINKKGETVLDFKYSNADSFKNGLAFVTERANNKAGYIDKTGKYIIELIKYDLLIDFRNNTRFYTYEKK